MKDFSFWREYEGASEGSGRSEKIWLQNPDTGKTGLFKYKKDHETTDHISECIAYQLAAVLEIPCAKFELGLYCGREGSMSYNIVEEPSTNLLEGINFIYYSYPFYAPEKFFDLNSHHMYSIEMIVNSIEKFVSSNGFMEMLLFDYLIGNSDRHQSNWAILVNEMGMNWSPLYDNSSSLCAYIQERQIDSYLGNDKNRWHALVDSKSRSLIRRTVNEEKRPTHLEILKYVNKNHYAQTCNLAERISALITEEKICEILSLYNSSDLTDKKKELIKKYILYKVNIMREIYFG